MSPNVTPPIFPPVHLSIAMDGLDVEPHRLSNGIPVHVYSASEDETLMLSFFFQHAGSAYQSQSLIAGTTNALLTEGTSTLSAAQIAEEIDFYGAFIDKSISRDHASISVFTLEKHAQHLIPLMESMIKDAAFPSKDLHLYLAKQKQQLTTSLQRSDFVAKRHFFSEVYGTDAPYGRFSVLGDYDQVGVEPLKAFHASHYRPDKCHIFVAGKCPPTLLQQLESAFGNWKVASPAETLNPFQTPVPPFKAAISMAKQEIFCHSYALESAAQASLCIGRALFAPTYSDMHAFSVLNCLLGGYFGSRLMTNLRENKGYTYGVYSGVRTFEQSSAFFISTNVQTDAAADAINEINEELQSLIHTPVSDEELLLVKNYLMGNVLRSMDGVFERAKIKEHQIAYHQTLEHFKQAINTIKTITPSALQAIATQYLQPADMCGIHVGSKPL